MSGLLLCYAFFGARNALFYRLLLARAVALAPHEYGAREAGRVYKWVYLKWIKHALNPKP